MIGGFFIISDDIDLVIISQFCKVLCMEIGSCVKVIDVGRIIFDDVYCERDWVNGFCQCKGDDKRYCKLILSDF